MIMLVSGIVTVVIGIVFIVIGVLNMKGNIKLLHSYHIKNIKEEDVKPFGRIVGMGMLVISLALIAQGTLSIIYEFNPQEILTTVGNVVLIVGLSVGGLIALFAIKKYNKSIF